MNAEFAHLKLPKFVPVKQTHNIPLIVAEGNGLAETWEKSIVLLLQQGCRIATQYDKKDDPDSYDASAVLCINDPLSEPRIHKDFPGGLEDLQEYVMEVLDGIKDHCVRDPNDPDDKRWEYTYHQRLFNYIVPVELQNGRIELRTIAERANVTGYKPEECISKLTSFDQIQMLAEQLAKAPHTRRAQAITWKVWEDTECYDPACLQSIWCRMLKGDDGKYRLNMNVRFRSNDAYKAAFMNMFALIRLQERIATTVGELIEAPVGVGRYVHMVDSYHIYGSYMDDIRNKFIPMLSNRSFLDRTYQFEDVRSVMYEAIPFILQKARLMK